jgi:ABC-type transport system involved in multi-copper enzyme maturation permease subunit
MNAITTFAWLTIHEARRRRIVQAALLLGVLFLALFGAGLHLIIQDQSSQATGTTSSLERSVTENLLTMAGLYVVHFLAIMLAIVATVDAISGEIASHTIQTLTTKPLARWQVVAGKWLGDVVMLVLYTGLLSIGVVVEGSLIAGYVPPNVVPGVALLLLEVVTVVSLSLAFGVFFSTLTNGIILFMLYGLAFIGSWIEQIGSLFSSAATGQIGVVSSLMLPVEALWRLAANLMQPPAFATFGISPFSLGAVPSVAMVFYAAGYSLVLLFVAMRAFDARDL